MPRFHFNVRSPEGAVIDPDGAEYPNAEAAYDAAARTARALTGAESEVGWLACVFEIADANGEVVFELPIAAAVEVATQAH
jgi:hypothetical protein